MKKLGIILTLTLLGQLAKANVSFDLVLLEDSGNKFQNQAVQLQVDANALEDEIVISGRGHAQFFNVLSDTEECGSLFVVAESKVENEEPHILFIEDHTGRKCKDLVPRTIKVRLIYEEAAQGKRKQTAVWQALAI